jgi:hypothetical protein
LIMLVLWEQEEKTDINIEANSKFARHFFIRWGTIYGFSVAFLNFTCVHRHCEELATKQPPSKNKFPSHPGHCEDPPLGGDEAISVSLCVSFSF